MKLPPDGRCKKLMTVVAEKVSYLKTAYNMQQPFYLERCKFNKYSRVFLYCL
jgi:hypothetical protein